MVMSLNTWVPCLLNRVKVERCVLATWQPHYLPALKEQRSDWPGARKHPLGVETSWLVLSSFCDIKSLYNRRLGRENEVYWCSVKKEKIHSTNKVLTCHRNRPSSSCSCLTVSIGRLTALGEGSSQEQQGKDKHLDKGWGQIFLFRLFGLLQKRSRICQNSSVVKKKIYMYIYIFA